MQAINDSLVERVRRLLALGTSTNENEAETALLKAKELAVRHGIDLAAIQVFDGPQKNEPISKEQIELGKRKRITQRFVSWILQNHFNIRIIYTGNRASGQQLIFIGKTSDIDIAGYVNVFLNYEFLKLWQNYRTKTCCELNQRNSYIYGLYYGLDQKLEKSGEKAKKEKFEELKKDKGVETKVRVENEYAIMVISRENELAEAVKQFFPKLAKAKRIQQKQVNSNAFSDGFEEGKQININKALNGTKQNHLDYVD